MTNPERISDERLREHLAVGRDAWSGIRSLTASEVYDVVTELLARRSPPAQEGMVLDAPAREGGGETKLIDDIINGTAPMSKWMGSVDYSTYDGFEEYLKTQLREKMDLKVRLDKKRHESAEDESLATFVDGGSGALEAALATYRTVRERVAAASPAEPAAHSLQTEPSAKLAWAIQAADGHLKRATMDYDSRDEIISVLLTEVRRAVLAASPAPSVSEPVARKPLSLFRQDGQCNCGACLRIRRDADERRSAIPAVADEKEGQ